MALSKIEVEVALKAANAAPFRAEGGRGGCGRAYVCVSGSKEEIRFVAAVCKKMGLIFQRKAYGVGDNAIYIGYDNASGGPLAKSRVFAEVLKDHGLSAYDDAMGD
jgi:hypothetical protein